jgi:hypothetical protein
VLAANDCDRLAGVDRDEERGREVRRKVEVAAADCEAHRHPGFDLHETHVGKAFCTQKFMGDILRCGADARGFRQSHSGRFRWSLLGQ